MAHLRLFRKWRSTWRNEANFGLKWLSRHGGRGFGKRYVRDLGGGLRSAGLGGLEVLESFEGTEEHAVCIINAPLNASKGIEGGVESVAERGIVLDGRVDEFGAGEGLVEDVNAVIPELGFDTPEASLDPFGRDESADERELNGVGGPVVERELFCEGFELGGIFGGDDVRPSVNA